jgi:hypothetical protein
MPRNDLEHYAVKRALEKDGWQIADEQVALIIEGRHLWVDLEAVRSSDRTLVLIEVKGFRSDSPVTDLANALGQYLLYRLVLEKEVDLSTRLYVAVPQYAFDGILSEKIGLEVREKIGFPLIVVDMDNEVIAQWIPTP